MNILDEAKAQGREIVTREGSKPDWIGRTKNCIVYGFHEGMPYFTAFNGKCLQRGSPVDADTDMDLILAPKKATIWYRASAHRIEQMSSRPPDPTESGFWRYVNVDLP